MIPKKNQSYNQVMNKKYSGKYGYKKCQYLYLINL